MASPATSGSVTATGNILYEKVLINKIHEIYIIPRFVGAQQSSIDIDGTTVPMHYFLSFVSHLVEVNQYTLQEFAHDLMTFCKRPEEHHKIPGDSVYHAIHSRCLVAIARRLPGFVFFKELLPVSSMVFTVQQHDDEFPVSWPQTYFVSCRENSSYLVRVNVEDHLHLDFQFYDGKQPDEDELLERFSLSPSVN